MRRIIICNTYYQLIVGIQLKLTLFASDYVVILISDHSRNSDMVCGRLSEMNLFDAALRVETKSLDQGRHRFHEAVDEFKVSVLGCGKMSAFHDAVMEESYDELIYFNINSSVFELYSLLSAKNRNMICSRMEEGILSYGAAFHTKGQGHYTKRIDCWLRLRKLLGKRSIFDNPGNFYCFYPHYYKGKLKPVQIPLISEKKISGNACLRYLL